MNYGGKLWKCIMEVNDGNRSDSMKEIEKQTIPNVVNLLQCKVKIITVRF